MGWAAGILRILVILLTFAATLEIPLRFAFPYPISAPLIALEITISVVFSLDILRQRLQRKGDKEALKSYLRGWLFIDALAAFPFFLWDNGAVYEMNHVLPVLRLIQLNRLFKLSHIFSFLNRWSFGHMIKPSIFRLSVFMVLASFMAHWIACGWVHLRGIPDGVPWMRVYTDALYWAVTTLTTVGYGDITPTTGSQKIYALLVMIAGVASYGYTIGNIASLLANLDLARARQVKKIEEVNAFLKYKNVPLVLRRKIHAYYHHLWEHHLDWDQREILNDLPENLKTEVSVFLFQPLLQKVPFLRGASADLITDLTAKLRPLIFPPDTEFIRFGEIGDSMYFISDGHVSILSEKNDQQYATLTAGQFVGEMALLLEQPRNANVVTMDYCTLYELRKEDFVRVLEKYPEFREDVARVLEERSDRIRQR